MAKRTLNNHPALSFADLPATPHTQDLQVFYLDRQARNLAPKTLGWYAQSLSHWHSFATDQATTHSSLITPSHLRCFLVTLAKQGHRVHFYTANGLSNELHQAQHEHRLSRFLDQALHHKLIIIDELGYLPFSPTDAQLLSQFCSALHERASLILTTNLPFREWVQVLGDERLTAGLLDRVTHKSHILEFVDESYRFR